MAPPQELGPTPLSTLDLVTRLLKSTPTEQLHHKAQYIASTLTPCKKLLSTEYGNTSAASSETAVAIHKFKTQLSTLLRDRSVNARWAAIVLVKASVELGGWEVLKTCKPWVEGLLGILKKPDPPMMKQLVLITLTRIFMLSKEYPTLVRDLTTPKLSEYIPTCLDLIWPKSISSFAQQSGTQRTLTPPILDSFNALMPRHPTIFRTYNSRIHSFLLQCIDLPGRRIPNVIVDAAHTLFIQLHHTAPQKGCGEEWSKNVKNIISSTHMVADHIFRSVRENWRTTTNHQTTITTNELTQEEPSKGSADALGLPPWTGLLAGSQRLSHLLRLLRRNLELTSQDAVSFPLGALVDLIRRLLLLIPPSSSKDTYGNVLPNLAISKEERRALWTVLPGIHEATMDLILALLDRYGKACIPFLQTALEDTLEVFAAEKIYPGLRATAYSCISAIMDLAGQSFDKSIISSLSTIIRSACQDLLPLSSPLSTATSLEKGQTNGLSNKSAQPDHKSHEISPAQIPTLRISAEYLLIAYIRRIPAKLTSSKLRIEIERTAILLQHKDLLLACVLNPIHRGAQQKSAASLLPFLARLHPGDMSVEALIHPRRPVALYGASHEDNVDIEDDEDEDEDEDEEMGEDDNLVNEVNENEEEGTTGLQPIKTSAFGFDFAKPGAKDPMHPTAPLASSMTDAEAVTPVAEVETSSVTFQSMKRVVSDTAVEGNEPPSKKSRVEGVNASGAEAGNERLSGTMVDDRTAQGEDRQVMVVQEEIEISTRPVQTMGASASGVGSSNALPPASTSAAPGDEESDDEEWQGQLHLGSDSDDNDE